MEDTWIVLFTLTEHLKLFLLQVSPNQIGAHYHAQRYFNIQTEVTTDLLIGRQPAQPQQSRSSRGFSYFHLSAILWQQRCFPGVREQVAVFLQDELKLVHTMGLIAVRKASLRTLQIHSAITCQNYCLHKQAISATPARLCTAQSPSSCDLITPFRFLSFFENPHIS